MPGGGGCGQSRIRSRSGRYPMRMALACSTSAGMVTPSVRRSWSLTRSGQSTANARSSGVSTAGCAYISVTPGRRSDNACSITFRVPIWCKWTMWSNDHACPRREFADTGLDVGTRVGAGKADGKTESHGQVQINAEEAGRELEYVNMGVEVGDVQPPGECALDLGSALRPYLLD